MALQGSYYGLPLTTLQNLLAAAESALLAVFTTGSSYSIGGRTLTRASVPDLQNQIMELQAAIDRASGNRMTVTYANMNPRPVRAGPATNFQATAPGG